ncbi:MAG: hypothetical protein AB8B59_05440 [Maribacter sp.]
MKKIIKIAFCLSAIGIQMGIELYPIVKVFAMKKVATINFKETLKNYQPFLEYTSFLAEEEKDELVLILEDFVRTKTKK